MKGEMLALGASISVAVMFPQVGQVVICAQVWHIFDYLTGK